MSVEIISQHSNTLPSGFKITFTVGRIVKDNPHSLPTSSPVADSPTLSLPWASGTNSAEVRP